MRCCVIGGAGFIGTWLVRELIASGRDVVVVGRRAEPPPGFPAGVRYVCAQLGDATLNQLVTEADEIVDLAYATVPQTSYADPVFDIQANLPPTVGLLDVARTPRLRRMVMVSSGGTVYGPSERLPIAESCQTNPVSPYGITKLTMEKYALMFHRLHGVPISIVRPANAYGVGQKPFTGQGFIATAMGSVLAGKAVTVFGETGTVRDYVHVADVARGIVAALTRGEVGEVYNIGSGIGRNNLEVLQAIEPLAARSGHALGIDFQPPRRFDVAANVLDCGKLQQCSGWRPVEDFDAGLEAMWDAIARDMRHGGPLRRDN